MNHRHTNTQHTGTDNNETYIQYTHVQVENTHTAVGSALSADSVSVYIENEVI